MSNLTRSALLSSILVLTMVGCSSGGSDLDDLDRAALSGSVFESNTELTGSEAEATPPGTASNPDKTAFFGDLHVHTTNSFDAYQFGTLATPDDAYRFAKGEAIDHPAGFELKQKRALDFYAVTDHAMFMGVAAEVADTTTDISKYEVTEPLHDINAPDNMGTDLSDLANRLSAFATFLPRLAGAVANGDIPRREVLDISDNAWQGVIAAAEKHNDPGRFTTFVGYEYTTSSDDSGNLHRNVIFKGSRVPVEPFSRFHSRNPEDLWDWMDTLRENGSESLAIPHNSNGSNGHMFAMTDFEGKPIEANYIEQRSRNEPLVEITQIKGTSETHPALSTRDEWANFEIMPYRVASNKLSEPNGSYVRQALSRGLTLESQTSKNPYAFGFIGSSDTHTAATENDESAFNSKLGLLSATEVSRGSAPLPWFDATLTSLFSSRTIKKIDGETYMTGAPPTFGASGLAGVWAEENTRDSIYAAFRRKETFATSGPRMRLRFFAGFDFSDSMVDADDMVARAYRTGVPMGGAISKNSGQLSFLLIATADPDAAPLQRLQIIKGWIDASGETQEEVIDVACAGGAKVNPKTLRCPDNGAKVDISDCSINRATGASELRTVWRDPNFDPDQRAFYYARVLENPTCRWSTWDAIRVGVAPRPDLQKTIQERAWSSPIQYLVG
ncbi:DUF3604 domain-containing protein [Sphingorhabdus sp. EL138]|uniref:DUF3604 domain-containing protein n=1 Tax=Sphingorhabdus sp. EL138 TaxID=2073156 RepID=UPI000D6868B9|nr:DUF3604 domain-containing protein [Sphingorhabdus sp. EL138]